MVLTITYCGNTTIVAILPLLSYCDNHHIWRYYLLWQYQGIEQYYHCIALWQSPIVVLPPLWPPAMTTGAPPADPPIMTSWPFLLFLMRMQSKVITYIRTRSQPALWAPTFSWRPFVLRSCDPWKGDITWANTITRINTMMRDPALQCQFLFNNNNNMVLAHLISWDILG